MELTQKIEESLKDKNVINEAVIPPLNHIGNTMGRKDGEDIVFKDIKDFKKKIEAFKKLYGNFPDLSLSGYYFTEPDYDYGNLKLEDFTNIKIGTKAIEMSGGGKKKLKIVPKNKNFSKATFFNPNF